MGLIFCVLVADLIVGFFHWLEDTYCKSGFPVVGELICEPNLEHHLNPSATFAVGNFFKRNYVQWIAAILVLALTIIIFGGFSWYWFFILLISSFGNEFHSWQHGVPNNEFTKFVFDAELIQSRKNHNLHHKPPHLDRYCIILSFNNAWLDRFNVWREMEEVIYEFTGIQPIRESNQEREDEV